MKDYYEKIIKLINCISPEGIKNLAFMGSYVTLVSATGGTSEKTNSTVSTSAQDMLPVFTKAGKLYQGILLELNVKLEAGAELEIRTGFEDNDGNKFYQKNTITFSEWKTKVTGDKLYYNIIPDDTFQTGTTTFKNIFKDDDSNVVEANKDDLIGIKVAKNFDLYARATYIKLLNNDSSNITKINVSMPKVNMMTPTDLQYLAESTCSSPSSPCQYINWEQNREREMFGINLTTTGGSKDIAQWKIIINEKLKNVNSESAVCKYIRNHTTSNTFNVECAATGTFNDTLAIGGKIDNTSTITVPKSVLLLGVSNTQRTPDMDP